jgi:superfamily II DNA/RNA helicase
LSRKGSIFNVTLFCFCFDYSLKYRNILDSRYYNLPLSFNTEFPFENTKSFSDNNLYMQFSELNIIQPILKAIEEEGYTIPTPIQEQAIPLVLAGNDLMGCAQTGTGKTAAFSIPIIQLLSENKEFKGKRKFVL